MERLISADKLRKDVLDLPNCYNGFSDTYDKAMIVDLVDGQPTVDAEPIRHGEWLMDDESGDIKCSCCGHWSFDMYDEPFVIDGHKGIATIMPHYCGYCGAKMDGGNI